jgi:hypothetical protein
MFLQFLYTKSMWEWTVVDYSLYSTIQSLVGT